MCGILPTIQTLGHVMTYDISPTCMLINMGLTRGECASWVQAWGSIIAIIVLIIVSHIDRKSALGMVLRSEEKLAVREREIAAAMLNRLGGSLKGVQQSIIEGNVEEVWGVKMWRTLLGSELEVIKGIPLTALNMDEQKQFFGLHTVAKITFEAIVFAEGQNFTNADKKFLVKDEAMFFLQNLVNANKASSDEHIAELAKNWN